MKGIARCKIYKTFLPVLATEVTQFTHRKKVGEFSKPFLKKHLILVMLTLMSNKTSFKFSVLP